MSSSVGAVLAVSGLDLDDVTTGWLGPAIVVLLGSTVVAGLLGTAVGNLRATADVRRDRYALAIRALISKLEYPYRIRRRTGDDPQTLAALAERGHDLQETLAQSRGWVAAESRVLAEVYDACLTTLDAPVKTACAEAWQSPPVAAAAEMNLAGFGPGDQQSAVARMECAVAYRFGWRRLLPAPLVRWRVRGRRLL